MKPTLLLFIVYICCCSVNGQDQVTQSDVKKLSREVRGITKELRHISSDSLSNKINSNLATTNLKLEAIALTLDSVNTTLSQPEPKWWGIRLSMIDEAVGAFIGALAAIMVFLSTIWWDKWKDKRRDKKEIRQNNFYLQTLISATIKQMKSQSNLIKNYSEKMKENPALFHEIEFITNEDLNRLFKCLEHEKYYHTYLDEFGDDENNVDDFRKITTGVDFLYGVVRRIKDDTTKNARQFDYNIQKFSKLLDDGSILATKIAGYPGIGKEVREVLFKYTGKLLSPDITANITTINEKYVTPFMEEIAATITNNGEAMLVHNMVANLMELQNLSSDIVGQNRNLAQKVGNRYSKMLKALNNLEQGAKEIITKYNKKASTPTPPSSTQNAQ